MADRSAIEWTDATWNPWHGCSKVSPGCAHCYAERLDQRLGRDFGRITRAPEQRFWQPLHWKRPRRVFTCSMSDFFHVAGDPWRPQAWDVIRATPHLTYQVLTKRPERIAACLPHDWGAGWPHVWLMTSAENQRFADLRIPELVKIPAAVHGVSLEPLLAPIDLSAWLAPAHPDWPPLGQRDPDSTYREYRPNEGWYTRTYNSIPGAFDLQAWRPPLHWVIAGGESGGPEQRRLVEHCQHRGVCYPIRTATNRCANCDDTGWKPKDLPLEWVRSLRNQCAGVPFFFKAWGGPTPKAGGRLLDGREWNEFPEVQQ